MSIFNQYILQPFLESASTFESRNAFCINEEFHSYKEFLNIISKIRILLAKSDFKEGNVGIVANDDIETYASIFAVWMEGLAYVPLHPKQPIERNNEIIDQAEIGLILDSSESTRFDNHQVINTIKLDHIYSEPINNEFPDNKLAYILFTSGSTGKPKGVTISRENIASFIKSFFTGGIEIDENDRCLQAFDLTFDVSVQSFLIPLIKGACVYTIPHDQIKYSYVYGLLEDHELTFGAMAPSMIRYLRPYFDEIRIPSMKYNILTAEASPYDLVKEWQECIPNAVIYDYYGPTEATIYCTYYKIPEETAVKTLNGMLSIGKPMDGLKAIIIDEDKIISEPNLKGELCIAGPQVTPGYWKNDEKNKSTFVNKSVDGKQYRYYKTGDAAHYDPQGDIMLSGRIDFQVKLQGYRVELGEIEFHARNFLGGKNAVAIPFENQAGNTELAMFIESEILTQDKLVAYLKSKLPSYMIPGKFYCKDKFPINTNGKVDRNELRKFL